MGSSSIWTMKCTDCCYQLLLAFALDGLYYYAFNVPSFKIYLIGIFNVKDISHSRDIINVNMLFSQFH